MVLVPSTKNEVILRLTILLVLDQPFAIRVFEDVKPHLSFMLNLEYSI
jgi:hypothetical protein